jgi:uncharacterized membrane protein
MPKFCTNCGSGLIEGAKFCNKCGATIHQTGQPQGAPPFTPPQPQASEYQPASQPPIYQAPSAGVDLQPNIAGALCYVLGFITGIIFLALTPHNRDRFVRFHAFQAIFFSVAWFVIVTITAILYLALPWPFDPIIGLISWVVRLGFLLTWLYLMYKAYNREMFKLPVIGDLAEKQAG